MRSARELSLLRSYSFAVAVCAVDNSLGAEYVRGPGRCVVKDEVRDLFGSSGALIVCTGNEGCVSFLGAHAVTERVFADARKHSGVDTVGVNAVDIDALGAEFPCRGLHKSLNRVFGCAVNSHSWAADNAADGGSDNDRAVALLCKNVAAVLENVLSDIEAEASQKAVFTCGASGVFHDLKKRDAYIEQARLALEYGINHCGKNCINYFFDNFTEIILRHGCDSIFAESLIVPEFKRLIDFDEENSTDYCQSLSCYIFERCDMTKAAAKLYVHRNSLMYRIKKCEEIMDVDLSDRKTYEKLWLCCTMRSIGALPSKAE